MAVADTEKEADRIARERNPDAVPLVLAIPTEADVRIILYRVGHLKPDKVNEVIEKVVEILRQ